MKNNALYIHGLNSNKNSDTFKKLKKEFPEYNWISDTFDLYAIDTTSNKICKLIHENNVKLLVGSSLGAFYVLADTSSIMKIIINPCMYPSEVIPKIDKISIQTLKKFNQKEQLIYNSNIIDNETRASIFGIFGKKDELFSFKSNFQKLYGTSNCLEVSDKHRLSQQNLVSSVHQALEYFKGFHRFLNEELINEHFINIITKEDTNKQKLEKYKDEVYSILQSSYAEIGGLYGCDNVETLINDTDFWKINIKNGKVVAVFVYTFKRGGRKLVYCGSDGTQIGKDALKKIIDDDIKFIERQSWAEVSGAMAHIYLKKGANVLDVEIAQKLLPDKQIIPLGRKVYQREIGGVMVKKIIVGNIK